MEIEAKVTFNEELLVRGYDFQKESFALVRGLMIAAVFLQLLAQGGKFSPLTFFSMFAFAIIWLLVLPAWRERREKRRLALHPWREKEVIFRFRPGFLTLLAPDKELDIDMGAITRASSDERGILVIGPKLGSLWIPAEAFTSGEQRASAWELLRASLKKKG